MRGIAVRSVVAFVVLVGVLPNASVGPAHAGLQPATKRCVGDPPRQTEDPMSPPCVAFHEGENGGSTWQGVRGDSVTVLVYMDDRPTFGSRGPEVPPPAGTFTDLSRPPASPETTRLRAVRALLRHFNERYQTYGRTVSGWAYSARADASGAARRADAQLVWERVRPFAVLNLTSDASLVFEQASARRAAMSFLTHRTVSEVGLSSAAPYMWGYHPSAALDAKLFSSFVCSQMAGRPVALAGDPTMLGRPRVFGILRSAAPSAGEAAFARRVTDDLTACDAAVAGDEPVVVPVAGPDPIAAHQAMARFRASGVTTVLWLKGYSTAPTAAATLTGYFPEWVVAGDGAHELEQNAARQDPLQWRRPVIVSTDQRRSPLEATACWNALFDQGAGADASAICPNDPGVFTSMRQLFQAVQLAGPGLQPASVEQGFRAVPWNEAAGPWSAACSYPGDDFTCVDDATVAWWDPAGGSRGLGPGCWRLFEDGRRRRAGEWPREPVERSPADPCSGWGGAGV
ncbi:MAG TPA: hypothetical protein VM840_12285 [Actinomycetota bacterium]|nr:hypothetical protein [Actinomycetota bacterium]